MLKTNKSAGNVHFIEVSGGVTVYCRVAISHHPEKSDMNIVQAKKERQAVRKTGGHTGEDS